MISTLTADQKNALHWAAVAIGLRKARERDGKPLSESELVHFRRYQENAYKHGLTDAQVHTYLRTQLG